MKILHATYVTKQPSTGKNISYRPFTVKEEKALMLALQEANIETVTNAIKSIVEICTDGKINPSKTPYYDIEFIFLQIRSKSIGEIIDMVGGCECDPKVKTDFTVDIADTIVTPDPIEKKTIVIPDTDYTIEIRHPSIDDFSKLIETNGECASEVVSNCIINVMTSDEVMDWSDPEKLEFVESMTPKQQKLVAAFLKNMPITQIPVKYKCKACGKEHSRTLKGFENFFI